MERQSKRNDEIVEGVYRDMAQMQLARYNFESLWDEVASYFIPDMRHTFQRGNDRSPGQKNTNKQIDSTAALALSRFTAILDSLLTPRNNIWHGLVPSNPDLAKDREVQLWFEEATRRLFKARYAPNANFSSQNSMIYKQLGAFGTAPMFVDQYRGYGAERGIRYKAVPLGEVFIKENHQGMVDGFVREFELTARQAYQFFGDELPDTIKGKLSTASEQKFKFWHCVKPREDWDKERIGVEGMRFVSYYISCEGRKLVRESGYNTFPMPTTRYEQYPGEMYGRGPGTLILPAVKTLNTAKSIMLKQGHRSVDPVLLTHDDGIANFSLRPGALNPGGVNAQGKALVQPLPVGNIAIGKDMMEDERAVVNDTMLVRLFQVLLEDPKVLTATQVVEMANEKGILLAPTIAGQQSGYLGPLIERELDVMAEQNMLPPMPPILIEAKGEYEVVYTSPFSKQAHSQEVSGLLRTWESILGYVNITQDPEPLDHFDMDEIVPNIADIQSVPEAWMASPQLVRAKRERRAQIQQQQTQIQAAPAEAALIKANAVAGKSTG